MISRLGLTSFKSLGKLFFYLFVAFLPLQINILIYDAGGLSMDFFNPYLSHFLYAGDIFLILALLFFSLSFLFGTGGRTKLIIANKKLFYFIFAFVSAYLFSICFSVNFVNSLLYFFRILELIIIYLIVTSGLVDKKVIQWIFIAIVSLSSLIGIAQYISQSSLGLQFLGETVLSPDMKGIAKISLGGLELIRAYGLFPHPNIFAGYLLFSIFFLFELYREKKALSLILIVLSFIALILTFSRSGIVALLIMIFFHFWKSRRSINYLFVLLLTACLLALHFASLDRLLFDRFVEGDQNAASERMLYIDISGAMITARPFGVGAGNFTQVMREYVDVKLLPWQIQPVHNIYLLVLSELGFLGFVIFIGLIVYLLKQKSKYRSLLLACLFVGFFDHYFISLPLGNNLLALLFAFYR